MLVMISGSSVLVFPSLVRGTMATSIMATAGDSDGGCRHGDTKQNCNDLRHDLVSRVVADRKFVTGRSGHLGLTRDPAPSSAAKHYGLVERANNLLNKITIR